LFDTLRTSSLDDGSMRHLKRSDDDDDDVDDDVDDDDQEGAWAAEGGC